MGWTTDEVDKYVAKIQRVTTDPNQKNLKGLAFARLYREAQDTNKAKRHLEAYLSVNETDFRGHRMMGQLFEETGNLEKALTSYRRSLDLNNTQHDLVLKVVELYCQVPVHPDRARAWADRAARLYPGHTAVFKLRMHLLESAGKIDYDQMEDLIAEEMVKRPRDVELHIRLVRIYASTGRLMDSFTHCVSVIKTKAFTNSPEWWRCAVDVFEKYMAGQDKMISSAKDIGPGHIILDLHAHLLGALGQLLSLYLKAESIRECKNAFYRLDHYLNMAHERKVRQLPQASHRTEWDVVLTEMRGQLYLHCGTLILKLAKENYLTWPRALKLASVCYLTSTQTAEPEINTPWIATAPKTKDALRWYRMACYRLSYSGHLLGCTANKYGEEWLDACISDWCTQQGQDEMLNTIYDEQRDITKSFLATDEEFFHLELNLPSPEQMIKFDEVCVSNNPRNLQVIAWIGLHWHQFEGIIRPGVGVVVSRIFDGLRMDVHNIEQTAATTLCLRDLEAFLYAVIRTSSAKHLDNQDDYRPDYQPLILPQQLCAALVTPAQEQWWVAAYNLYSGAASASHSGKVRATVQRGLEVIRALGNHGLHVRLLIYMALNFGSKASFLKTAAGLTPWYYEEHWKSLQARSLHYWKEVLVLLEKRESNESSPVPKDCLFNPWQDSLQEVDVKFNLDRARLLLGEAAIKEGRIEEAMEMFEQVKTTQAMWNLAQIYKYLANVEAQAAATDDLGSEAHSNTPAQEYYNCLKKAKDLLLVCMDKVGTEERRRQIVQDELNGVEDKLNEDPNKVQKSTKKQLDFRQLDFQASRSSTTVSDMQESEDNFWLDQPQDGSSKDLIAKLSEVTLNNGCLQEQMARRDKYVQDLTDKVHNLETEIREMKLHQYSGMMSPANLTSMSSLTSVTSRATPTTLASPLLQDTSIAAPTSITSITPTSSLHLMPPNGYPTESTPVAKPSVKSRLGPRIPPVPKPGLPKIDANFFAGLSQSNSPDRRLEQEREEDEDEEEEASEQGSPRHESVTDDGIHFEPIIPLPKKVENKTGEEGEEVLFEKRAKLYRFVKDEKAWKERGHGTLKILASQDAAQFRILMRRDQILKICANHLITKDMDLKPLKSGSTNSVAWTTLADFADEVPQPEQLAVRFKLPEETAEFKEVFEECKRKISNASNTAPYVEPNERHECKTESSISPKYTLWNCSVCPVKNQPNTIVCIACGAPKLASNVKDSSSNVDGKPQVPREDVAHSEVAHSPLLSKFMLKPGSWECSGCYVNNEPNAQSCVACGYINPTSSGFDTIKSLLATSGKGKHSSFGLQKSSEQPPLCGANSGFSFGPQNGSFTAPPSVTTAGPDSTTGFPFAFSPQTTLGKEADQVKAKKSIFPMQPTPFSFAYQPTSSSESPLSFSFGPTQAPSPLATSGVSTATASAGVLSAPTFGFSANPSPFSFSLGSSSSTPDGRDTEKTQDKPLTFSSSPSGVIPGFGISDDEDETLKVSSSQASPKSTVTEQPESSTDASQETASQAVSATTIMPQNFWQQQLEEKFRFGNLHKTQPLAGMAPAVAPPSGKSGSMFPASFSLNQMAGNVQAKPSTGTVPSASYVAQPPDLLMSILLGKPKETASPPGYQAQQEPSFVPNPFGSNKPITEEPDPFGQDNYDDYSDDYDATETDDDSESYKSSEGDSDEDLRETIISQPASLRQQMQTQNASYNAPTTRESMSMSVSNMNQNLGIPGRKFLTARSPLKKGQASDGECVIIYQIRAQKDDQDKAAQLLLPPSFYNYLRSEPCPGCLGCDPSKWSALRQETPEKPPRDHIPSGSQPRPKETKQKENSPIFGTSSGTKELSFASFATSSEWASSKKGSEHRAFPKAGQQLFSSTENEDPSEEVDVSFKPLISLPELIECKTGEEDHTLLFSERARLYRFDAPSCMWKERGIGDIKLLLDNKSGRGRVVMRREQIRKLCANHWVTKDMELITNSSSERSWVWQTLSDFSEEVPSQERLAVRFKSTESAAKFKEVFENLIILSKKCLPRDDAQKKVHFQPLQQEVGTWSCDNCYCDNPDKDTACLACGSGKKQSINDKNVQSSTVQSKSQPSVKSDEKPMPKLIPLEEVAKDKLGTKLLFTIGRADAPEETLEKESYMTSPSKTSPSKSPLNSTPTMQPAFAPVKHQSSSGFALSSEKFNFRLDLGSTESTPVKSPLRSPVKSPQSPTSPGFPGSHPETEDDGIHFEPLIPLPKLVTKTTGEENEDLLFCQRAKVFRYEADGNQWKERGVGEVKILKSLKSGKSRILMRRDTVFKVCVNHQITSEMELKSKTEKSWIWNTLADFADEVPKAETLAIRFKTSDIANEFKDAFDKARNDAIQQRDGTSSTKSVEKPAEKSAEKPEHDGVDASNQGNAAPIKHEPPQQKNDDEEKSTESAQEQSLSTPEQEQSQKEDKKKSPIQKETSLPIDFLFGSSNISSLSFASVAANLNSSPEFKGKDDKKGFEGAVSSPSPRKESESEDHHDNDPHFEPIIPLPEKIEVKTGEEDEDVVFSHRAKLYRFDRESKQWKERGVGDIKILYHKKNGRVRILMRRDQIHKICANHYVTPAMKLMPGTNTKSLVWNTLADFSDEEVKPEQLAVRFKLEATAQEFKDKFEEWQEKIKEPVESKEEEKSTSESSHEPDDKTAKDTQSFMDKFKPKPGSWECEVCCVSNKQESATCIACQSPNPGYKPQQTFDETAKDTQSSFLDKFKPKPGSWECEICYVPNRQESVTCIACMSPKPGSKTQQTFDDLQNQPKFQFGAPIKPPASTGFTFSFGTSIGGASNADTSSSTPESQTSLVELFKLQPGEWECQACLVPNKAESTSCVACQTKRSSSNSGQTSSSSFGGPNPTGFSFGSSDNENQIPFSFRSGSSGQTSSSSQPSSTFGDQKPTGFSFASSKVENQSPFSFGSGSSASGQTSSSQVRSSTDEPSSTTGGPKPTGFTFGSSSGDNENTSFGTGSLQGPKPSGFSSGSSGGENQKPFSFGFPCASPSVDTENKSDEGSRLNDDQGEVNFDDKEGNESITDKFKPKPGSWECETCLIQNNAECTTCAACETPKPGSDSAQKSSTSLPSFNFGSSKPGSWECETCLIQNNAECTICAACEMPKPGSDSAQKSSPSLPSFNFGPSKPSSNTENQKPFSFGQSTFSFAPEVNREKGDSQPQFKFEDSKFTGFSFGANASDSPGQFSFGFLSSTKEQESPSSSHEEKGSDVPTVESNVIEDEADSTSSSEIEEIAPETNNQNMNSSSVASEECDPTITSVVGPSDEEKNRAKALMLPEGFFLYQRKPDNDPEDSQETKKEPHTVPETKPLEQNQEDKKDSPKPVDQNQKDKKDSPKPVEQNQEDKKDSPKPVEQNQVDKNEFPKPVEQNQEDTNEFPKPVEQNQEDTNEFPKPVEQNQVDKNEFPKPVEQNQEDTNEFTKPVEQHQEDTNEFSKPVEQNQVDKNEFPKPVEQNQEDKNESPKPTAVFGSSSSQPFASFSDVCADRGFQFGSSKSTKGFTGQGSQVFGVSQSKEDEHPEEECDTHFQPIVELAKVEVLTGEEKEEKVFSHRAKLYRFDQPTSQWKERGVGDIKILKHRDGNKFRILMRRDQIHKVCANHIITTDMKLVPNAMSDRSWVWCTLADLSDEEPSPEQFAVRFKFAAVAEEFKNAFEKCQQEMQEKATVDSTTEQRSENIDDEKVEQPVQLPRASLEIGRKLSSAGELLNSNATENMDAKISTKNRGCTSCHIPNYHADKSCVGCGESKPDDQPVNITSTAAVKESQNEKTSDDVQTADADSTTKESASEGKPKTGFLCGTKSVSSLSFGDAAAKSNLFGEVSSTEPFSFKGLNDPKPDRDVKEDEDHDDEEYHNASGDHIHFEPIIPLPEKVEVVTGEEKEEVLFKERSKMFRFDKHTKQWKERGTGELKILSRNGRARILMRRDHILKLCANHIITPDMSLTPNGNSDRSWVWQTLADYSEEEPKPEQLAVRFKTAEIANAFKKTFQECTVQELPSSTTETEDEEENKKSEDCFHVSSKCGETALVSMPESTQDLASMSISTQLFVDVKSKVVQQSVRTSSTITKQEVSCQQSTTSHVETTASSEMHQEQKIELSLQDEGISSSSEGQPQEPQIHQMISPSPPSIFNQQLLSQRSSGFPPGGIFPFAGAHFAGKPFSQQPDFPSSLTSPQFPGTPPETEGFTKVTSSTQQTMSKRTEVTSTQTEGQTFEERKVVQQMEASKVETRESVSSSSGKSPEKQTVSCSPEINKMLQEIENSDEK